MVFHNEEGVKHQGKIVAQYRKINKWSRSKLAEALHVDVSTIYRMEQNSMIKDVQRRQLLVGLLGIPTVLMGLNSTQHLPVVTNIALNEDRMNFFENVVTTRWDVYHTGGTTRANRGLDMWIKEAENFAQETKGSVWNERGHTLLSMSYQLGGSIFRDMMEYDQADRSYQKAFNIAKELDDKELMSSALARNGVSYIQQNNPSKAIECLNASLNLVNGLGLPSLRGYILQALSEAHAMAKQEVESRRSIDLAQRTLERRGEVLERSNCYPNTSSVVAQKGVNAVLLGNDEWAITLLDKSLEKYDHSYVRGRARLIAQKAEAYFALGLIDACCTTAQEALKLAYSSGSKKTLARIQTLCATLTQSKWSREPYVVHLNLLIQQQGAFTVL